MTVERNVKGHDTHYSRKNCVPHVHESKGLSGTNKKDPSSSVKAIPTFIKPLLCLVWLPNHHTQMNIVGPKKDNSSFALTQEAPGQWQLRLPRFREG